MAAVETHTSLALLWSGPGLARSVVVASSPGLVGSEPWGIAETVISSGGAADRHRIGLDGSGCGPHVPGQRLGRYRLIERLGRGCQGDVWRATEATHESGGGAAEVALKLLTPSSARDPRRLAQFRREAERRARLAVPSVLPTTEFGEADGIPFMVMPLVDGCSLGEVVAWRRRGSLELREPIDPRHPLADAHEALYLRGVVQVMGRVARTLQQVHAARVVHRDIKPANILLDRHRVDGVFLCDFGLSRDLDIATPDQLRDGAGTPLYMPPERLLRLSADEVLCDIYAMGATLYEAVTLVPPVQVPESLPWSAWASYLATTRPSPPRELRPDLPEALDAIIVRCMAHEPPRRYPSAACLAADLERALGQLGEPPFTATAPGKARAGSGAAPSSPRETVPEPAGRIRPWALAACWQSRHHELAETILSRLSTTPNRLVHPDIEAWEAPFAAE